MSVNKIEIQRLIDFLDQWKTPIDMNSVFNCAACLIGNHVYGLEFSFYSLSIKEIEEHAGLDRDTINEIFCNALDRKTAMEEGDEWIYPVDHSRDVTKEMVIEQLQKFL